MHVHITLHCNPLSLTAKYIFLLRVYLQRVRGVVCVCKWMSMSQALETLTKHSFANVTKASGFRYSVIHNFALLVDVICPGGLRGGGEVVYKHPPQRWMGKISLCRKVMNESSKIPHSYQTTTCVVQ